MEDQARTKIKVQRQIDLHQTEDELRKTRSQIVLLEVDLRKFKQEYTHAEMNVRLTEDKLKVLKSREIELNQQSVVQRKAYYDSVSDQR